jgi:hypothetical protein
MKTFKAVLKLWIPLVVAISLICVIIYIAEQQNYRQNANDPQYQMAEDVVNALDNGADPSSLFQESPSELTTTLSPYVIIYDETGKDVISAALLDGKIPKMPSGVLDYVRKYGSDVITWQPRKGVRQALVIKKTSGQKIYFVVAGRSLQKVEERTASLIKMIKIVWLFSVVVLFFVVWGANVLFKIE